MNIYNSYPRTSAPYSIRNIAKKLGYKDVVNIEEGIEEKKVYRVTYKHSPEVFSSVPDYEEAIQICKDNGYEYQDYYSNYYLLEYEWIDIGEGESGVDKFIDDETLLFLYKEYHCTIRIFLSSFRSRGHS